MPLLREALMPSPFQDVRILRSVEQLTARCQLTRSERTHAARALLRRRPIVWATLTAGAIAAVVGVVLGSVGVVVTGLGLVAMVGSAYHTPGRVGLASVIEDAARPVTEFVASEEGFGFHPASNGARAWCPWSHYRYFRQAGDLYLLRHARRAPWWDKGGRRPPTVVLPLRAFASGQDADRFRELATRYIGQHRP